MNNIDPITFKFRTHVQIRISDLDPYGHVNNGAQSHIYDYGRTKYFEEVSGKPINWKTMDLVMAHLCIDFFQEIGPNVNLYCNTKVTKIGHKSVHMIQQLTDKSGEVIFSECKSVLACIDRSTGKAIPVSESARKLYEKYERYN